MKVNIRKDEIVKFKPFILEVKIENLAEAKKIWYWLNKPDMYFDSWKAVDLELEEQGFETEDW